MTEFILYYAVWYYAFWFIIPLAVLVLYRRRPPRLVIAGVILSLLPVYHRWWALGVIQFAVQIATLVYTIVDIKRARRLNA
jgi:hypothetical protein